MISVSHFVSWNSSSSCRRVLDWLLLLFLLLLFLFLLLLLLSLLVLVLLQVLLLFLLSRRRADPTAWNSASLSTIAPI